MPKKLLIVEDDLDIQQILHYIFIAEGYEVVFSDDGVAATGLQAPYPDLILMDVNLKGAPQNGDEICLLLKSEPLTHDVPIVLLSAEPDLHLICNTCGADAFLYKPFDVVKLTSMVEGLIGGAAF